MANTLFMDQDTRSFFRQYCDAYLDRLADRRSKQFINSYAMNGNGVLDEALAYRIQREVYRRSAMSKELDIYEPLRWAGISGLLSAAAGVGVKLTTEKTFSRPALIALMATTALTSVIQLVRLVPRYEAALRGGADTACAMHGFDKLPPGQRFATDICFDDGPWATKISTAEIPTDKGPSR